jgi:hypothetical protein
MVATLVRTIFAQPDAAYAAGGRALRVSTYLSWLRGVLDGRLPLAIRPLAPDLHQMRGGVDHHAGRVIRLASRLA